MSWLELHVTTSAEIANELSEQLSLLGAVAVTFQDAGNHPIYEPSPDTPRIWQLTHVSGLFNHDHDMAAVITHLKKQTFGSSLSFHIIPIADEAWERRCLDDFKPIACGKRLWICPSWHTPPDPTAVNIVLDPGLAFGTGTHPTTQLCLNWLDQHITSEDYLIDYGCGSGILGIAAIKLGVKQVFAVDTDPLALETTKQNAIRNQIDPSQLNIELPTAPIRPHADILIANILAKPLLDLVHFFGSFIKPNGKIVLSGILIEQIDSILDVYNPLFIMKKPIICQEWVCLEGVKRIKT